MLATMLSGFFQLRRKPDGIRRAVSLVRVRVLIHLGTAPKTHRVTPRAAPQPVVKTVDPSLEGRGFQPRRQAWPKIFKGYVSAWEAAGLKEPV
mgnify:CR=1 FL=1